jgi:hypothetical protein
MTRQAAVRSPEFSFNSRQIEEGFFAKRKKFTLLKSTLQRRVQPAEL